MGKKYELYNTTAKEVVDVHDNLADMEEAKEFFYLKKRIPSKDDFDKLYEVRQRKNDTQNSVF